MSKLLRDAVGRKVDGPGSDTDTEVSVGGESHRVGGGQHEGFVIGRRLSYHSSAVNVPLDIGICGAGEGLTGRQSA